MKQNIFLIGTIALAMTAASCSNDDKTVEPQDTMPEGTADVTINETDANFADYRTNWCSYAAAVSSRLKTDAETLYKAWNEGLDGEEAYQTTFKECKAPYTSPNSCIEQIVDGCIDISNEVGESKIGDPRDKWENKKYTEAVYAVESWYSYHSIQDYANNIRSIQNAFNCTYKGVQGSHSIAKYLQAHGQTDLANQVNTAITKAINSIEGMAAPFRSHIGNPSVVTAMEACNLKDANTALHVAVQALAANPTNVTFEQAAAAWMAARQPWEMSEGFLFGPVDELGLDPNMDSWPLDQDAIKNVLASGDFTGLDWSGDFDEENESIAEAQSIRGFHTLEFLLFKNGQPRRIN